MIDADCAFVIVQVVPAQSKRNYKNHLKIKINQSNNLKINHTLLIVKCLYNTNLKIYNHEKTFDLFRIDKHLYRLQ